VFYSIILRLPEKKQRHDYNSWKCCSNNQKHENGLEEKKCKNRKKNKTKNIYFFISEE